MAKRAVKDPAEFIVPLNMNGLSGRMLLMPAPRRHHKREILFIYGMHSSIERWWGLIQEINHYGAVTVPDLPGFGGMDSLYKIGRKPTFDEMADYLAAFVKLRYKRKRITIVGLSIGFPIVTRMLERYPEIAGRVDMLVSVVGFAHHDDFTFTKRRQAVYKYGSRFFLPWPTHWFLRHVVISPFVLRRVYHHTLNAKEKFTEMSGDEFQRTMDLEIALWQINDLRTWLMTTIEMFRLDNCKAKVDLPVWHVRVKHDRYFDPHMVEQHFRVIFRDYREVISKSDSHGPSVIATAEEAAKVIPPELRRELAKR